MKSSRIVAVVASALLLSTGSAMAGGVQIDLDGLYASPTGSDADGVDLSDFVDGGLGGRVSVLFGASESLAIGGSIGFHSNSGAGDLDALSLRSMPVHGIVMWRSTGEGPVGFYIRGGAGMTRHSINFEDDNPDRSQSSFSWEAGAGVSFHVSDSWDLTGGASYTAASTGESTETDRIWNDGDNPKFLLFSIGMRYRAKSGE